MKPGSPSNTPSTPRLLRSAADRLPLPLQQHLRQAKHRLNLRARFFFQREHPRVRLFVLATPRCGSNLLIDYLNHLPGMVALGEVLHGQFPIGIRRRWITKQTALRHLDYSLNVAADVVAAKLMMEAMRCHSIGVTDLAQRYPNARFIVLYRRHLGRQFVSLKIASLTGATRYRGKRFDGTINVEGERFLQFCSEQKKLYSDVISDKAVQNHGTVFSYEELTSDPQAVFERAVFPLLGLKPTRLTTSLEKQNTRSLAEIVANHAELKDLFESDAATLKIATV